MEHTLRTNNTMLPPAPTKPEPVFSFIDRNATPSDETSERSRVSAVHTWVFMEAIREEHQTVTMSSLTLLLALVVGSGFALYPAFNGKDGRDDDTVTVPTLS
jgi:hypothetical protein